MKLQIVGRHFDVSDRLRTHVEKEAAKLERFCDRIIDCQVFVAAEKQAKLVEVVVKVHAHTLKATSSGPSVYQALEETMERVKSQVKKLQGKFRERRRGRVKIGTALAGSEG